MVSGIPEELLDDEDELELDELLVDELLPEEVLVFDDPPPPPPPPPQAASINTDVSSTEYVIFLFINLILFCMHCVSAIHSSIFVKICPWPKN